jgi:GTP pyrophosphokinase
MHEENEKGIAAHWIYREKRGEKGGGGKNIGRPEEIRWVQQLRNWQEKYNDPDVDPRDFLESMKVDFFQDRIFAITPRGDVIDLPAGATPIDFAYYIHSEVGNSCVGAKVNNHFVPLSHALKSGDVVEILTQKNKRPSQDWLQFVKTALARDHIRTALREKRGFTAPTAPTKAELRLVLQDRIGLIKDITAIIARSHINILSLHTNTSPGSHYPIDRIECGTTDRQKIEKLILKLKKIKEIKEISYRLI